MTTNIGCFGTRGAFSFGSVETSKTILYTIWRNGPIARAKFWREDCPSFLKSRCVYERSLRMGRNVCVYVCARFAVVKVDLAKMWLESVWRSEPRRDQNNTAGRLL